MTSEEKIIKTKKWLIMYYPVTPNVEFVVYDISAVSPYDYLESQTANVFHSYLFGREQVAKMRENSGRPMTKIIGWNNSWWMTSDKGSLKQAIEEFWESYFKYLTGEGEPEEIGG